MEYDDLSAKQANMNNRGCNSWQEEISAFYVPGRGRTEILHCSPPSGTMFQACMPSFRE